MRKFINSETFREILQYDPESGLFTWKVRDDRHVAKSHINNWNNLWAGKKAFIHSDRGAYLRASIFGQFYSAHRVAWAIYYGDPVPKYIDHIDGDRTNNRISNLRETDSSGNAKNRGIRGDNTSGRTGIHKTKSGTYRVRIFVEGKDRYVGTFKVFEEALEARRKSERQNGFSEGHGERFGFPSFLAKKSE